MFTMFRIFHSVILCYIASFKSISDSEFFSFGKEISSRIDTLFGLFDNLYIRDKVVGSTTISAASMIYLFVIMSPFRNYLTPVASYLFFVLRK